jgi:hypothetical protein
MTDAYRIFDMCFGSAVVETWKLPSCSKKAGFTMTDVRDIIVGRYQHLDMIEDGKIHPSVSVC